VSVIAVKCQCPMHAGDECAIQSTQEDFLCDRCREAREYLQLSITRPDLEGKNTRVFVNLECGHHFYETRPTDVAHPVQWELRACGHPEHYPDQYRATYFSFEEAG
jgi:hypothetical protein